MAAPSQILGAAVGALLEAALVPGLRWAWFGAKNKATPPGCFYPGVVNSWELFLWELVLTFVLVRPFSGPSQPCTQLLQVSQGLRSVPAQSQRSKCASAEYRLHLCKACSSFILAAKLHSAEMLHTSCAISSCLS